MYFISTPHASAPNALRLPMPSTVAQQVQQSVQEPLEVRAIIGRKY